MVVVDDEEEVVGETEVVVVEVVEERVGEERETDGRVVVIGREGREREREGVDKEREDIKWDAPARERKRTRKEMMQMRVMATKQSQLFM